MAFPLQSFGKKIRFGAMQSKNKLDLAVPTDLSQFVFQNLTFSQQNLRASFWGFFGCFIFCLFF